MIDRIAIIGAGGFGREVQQLIEDINNVKPRWIIDGFFDAHKQLGTVINGLPVLGGDDDAIRCTCRNFVLAIGHASTLQRLSTMFTAAGKSFPNIIHPLAHLGNSNLNHLGKGNIFTYGCHATTNVTVGDFNIFNTRVTLGHDVRVGSFNLFSPNVQVSGNVQIGDANTFGLNSSVLENISVGSYNRIGGHSFVISHLGTKQSVFGCPAKMM